MTSTHLREFVIDSFRVQTAWDWRIAFYLFLSAVSGGLIVMGIIFRIFGLIQETTVTLGAWIAFALVCLSLLVLFSHLGGGRARWRSYRAIVNIRHSWTSRGATIDSILLALLVLFLAPEIWHSLPWREGTVSGSVLRGAIIAFAVAFMAYSGLTMSWWKSIPFWNTFLLPVLYTGYSFLAGAAALPIILLVKEGRSGLSSASNVIWPLILGLMLVGAALLALYIWQKSGADASGKESIRLLAKGEARWAWWGGVIVLGLVIPVIIAALAAGSIIGTSVAGTSLLMVCCAAVLIGGYILRYCVLKVGVYVRLL